MATPPRSAGRRIRRSLAAALLCVATLASLAVPASAQRSRGNFFVYQSLNCTGLAERSNDPHVSVPFSVGGRNYPANIELRLFAYDLNTDPNDVFGPFVTTTDADGRFCELVFQARPTHWKIDLVEPGSGFTDSKVITVIPSAPPTTTTLPSTTTPTTAITTTSVPGQTTTTTASTTTTSTTVPGQTTTVATTTTTLPPTTTTLPPTTTTVPPTTTTAPTTTAPTTTLPGQTTTAPSTTLPGQPTTTAPPGQTTTTVAGQTTTAAPGQTTTIAATTTVAGQTTTTAVGGATTSAPEQDLGFEAEPVVPVPPEGVLPATGSGEPSELTAIAVALLLIGGFAYFIVRRRKPARP